MSTAASPKATRKGGWGKKLGILAGALLVLLVIGWFVITSGAFFKSFILPRVGTAINAQVTVEDVSLSPFSTVTLRKLVVHPNGAEPLFQADEIRARYSLWSIIRGNIVVEEVVVDAPKLTIVQNADGTSNLDPLTKNASKTPATKEPKSPKAATPPQVNVKSVAIKNGSVRVTQHAKVGADQITEVNGFNLSLADLKNSGTAKLDLGAALSLTKPGAANTTATALVATLKSAMQVSFDASLQPQTLRGDTEFVITQATGDLKDAAAVSAKLTTEVSPTEVKQLLLAFTKSGQGIGSLQVSGPFDLARQEGKLIVSVSSIDRQVLNLAGALAGVDFGGTTISSTNTVELKNAGQTIAVIGQVLARSFSVTQNSQTTPALDLTTSYEVTVDQTSQSALIKSFAFDGTQRGRLLLNGSLSKPMPINWGKAAGAVDESALKLKLTGFDLRDWRAFTGTNVRSGIINAEMDLLSQQAGQKLTFAGSTKVAGLSADFGTTHLDQVGLDLALRGTLDGLQKFGLTGCTGSVTRAGQEVAALQASGTVDLKSLDVDLQAALNASLPEAAALAGQPGLQFSAGRLQFNGSVKQQNQAPAVKGSLKLSPLSGTAAGLTLDRLEAALDCDFAVKSQIATINQFAGKLTSAGQPGGAFDVSGRYDLQKQTGEVTAKVVDLNQNLLRPFLAVSLGNKQLVSGSINANVTARYDVKAESAVKGDVQMANFVINDPSGQIPKSALGAAAVLDVSFLRQVLDLRQCRLALAPTARATNVINLTGKLDLTRSNAITGALKLAADSLDVTTYYDLFTGGPAKPAATAPTSTKSAAVGPEVEPAAVQLPFKNFIAEATIGRFYLREVEITNLQASLKLDGGHVVINPLKFGLNGVPVSASADMDLGVPGYRYDVMLNAPGILLAPFVNSFMPERKGQFSGTLAASVQLKGAGVTGAGLQKNLNGKFDVVSTNLNLAIGNLRSSAMKGVLNVIIGIPEGIRNPGAAIGNLLGRLTGESHSSGGWADEFTKSPINSVVVRGTAGGGKIELTQMFAESSAFQANAAGTIGLASVLNNSTLNFPVNVSLRRELSDKVGLTPANTPTNALYARIPDFVTVKGTVGTPEVRKDYLVLAQVTLKAGGGVIGGTAGAILGQATGILGALTGQSQQPGVTNATAVTNQAGAAPATNQAPPRNLLDLLNPPKDTNRVADPDKAAKKQQKKGN